MLRRLIAAATVLLLVNPPVVWAASSSYLGRPADLSNPTGTLGIPNGGTGATTVPAARSNLGAMPALNAKTDYGAKGDNSTNDGPALASALAACSVTQPLYLPPGIYKTQQPLTTPAGCKFYGDNVKGYYTGGGGPQPTAVIVADNTASGFAANSAVLTLGSNSLVKGIASFGISGTANDFATPSGGTLDGVLGANGKNGVNCTGGATTIIYSEFALNSGTAEIGSCPDLTFNFNFVHTQGSDGVYLGATVKGNVIGNTFEWNTGAGLEIDGRSSPSNLITVAGNVLDRNTGPCLLLETTTAVTVVGNTFRRCGAGGAGGYHVGFSGANTGLQMAGNVYETAHINDDGSGIIAPDYVYNAAALSTFSGSITDNPTAQNVGIYTAGSQALMTGVKFGTDSLNILPNAAQTTVTSQAQATGGSTLLPFASTSGISVGQIAQGTSIPLGDLVASIVSTASVTLTANGISASGQKILTTTTTAGAAVGQQCTDLTTTAAIGAGNVIASIQAGVSITMTTNLAGATANNDSIRCDPVVSLTTATSPAVASGASINFIANATSVSASSASYNRGDESTEGNGSFGGALKAGTYGSSINFSSSTYGLVWPGTSPTFGSNLFYNGWFMGGGSVSFNYFSSGTKTAILIGVGLTTFGGALPEHIASTQTTPPALTSCGTGSPSDVGATDSAGTVTMGTGATGCIITFNAAYTTAPHCVVTWRATPLASQSYTVSNTAIQLTQTSASGDLVDFVCVAPSGG